MPNHTVPVDGGAMPAEGPPTRRGFLSGLATLPLIGGAFAILGAPTAVAVAPNRALLDRYVAWLAHEHAAALAEVYNPLSSRRGAREMAGRDFCVPMFWFPDSPEVERLVAARKPSTRAALVLSAVGADWRV